MDKVSIVITSHGEAEDLPVILGSIANQFEYVVGKNTHGGTPVHYVKGDKLDCPLEVIITYDGYLDDNDVNWRLIDSFSHHKIIQNPKGKNVGHNTRTPGILAATGDWIVLTNSDNYFMSGWLWEVGKYMKPSVGMIFWNGINNLWIWGNHGGTKLKRGFVDLSFVMVRSEIAKEVQFPFTNYDGDADYISACAKLCDEKKLLKAKTECHLSVHN